MPCFSPLDAWNKRGGGITFTPAASNGIPIKIPCGQCIGCRAQRKADWALRIGHEIKMHQHSIFVTLTYDNEHLPANESLSVREVQLFNKRLRKAISPARYRFFAVGEYGDRLGRPHYHIILFGYWPQDAKRGPRKGDYYSWTSDFLTSVWGKGLVQFSEAHPNNAKYCSQYTVKKITGPRAENHYEHVTRYGELVQRLPEFSLQSRRPGIGASFFDQYHAELLASDHAIDGGRKAKLPKYYDKLHARLKGEANLEKTKERRKQKARTPAARANTTPERLADRGKYREAVSRFNKQAKGSQL